MLYRFRSHTDQIFLESPSGRGNLQRHRHLTIDEKQQIVFFRDENPNLSDRKVAQHFTQVFGREIGHMVIHRIKKCRERILSNLGQSGRHVKNPKELALTRELYDEICLRNNFTTENLATTENLRALALELACQSKYEGFFANFKFGPKWISNFRKSYNIYRNFSSTLTLDVKPYHFQP